MYFKNLEMHIFHHILTQIPKNLNFFHKTLKNQKKFSANNEQSSMKCGEKWFSEKLQKKFDLENFRSDSRAPASELVLQRIGLPSKIALPGEASSSKLGIEGWVRTLKNQTNIFV